MLYTRDSLEFLTSKGDKEVDIIFCDPPYALGSEVVIRPDGKVDYAKAVDFMNKWDMPTGEYWEKWFQEAYRVLKYGGYCIMYGMDRQLLIFKYYASLSGFQEQQSLYWYFISNFPKATDLSKMIDKNAGAEREVVGQQTVPDIRGNAFSVQNDNQNGSYENINVTITAPATDLAKKYEGYKYSISPLKQTNETIMVFQKPYKTGSCLHDTLAYENGDDTCCCGALDIDGNRVETNEDLSISGRNNESMDTRGQGWGFKRVDRGNEGRYPSQTFCDSNTAEVLDRQSGIKVSKVSKVSNKGSIWGSDNEEERIAGHNDKGGCSKILHKCDYEIGEYDLYVYCPKVSRGERNAGCENREREMVVRQGLAGEKIIQHTSTTHPTLKPISLNEQILKLFKTPNEQFIVYPFAGAGSEIIGGIRAGFENWEGCELSEEYTEIANARIEWWSNRYEMIGDKKVWIRDLPKSEEVIEDELQMSMFDMWEV